MLRLVPAALLLAALAVAQPASAACTSKKCPDQLAIDDLRARISARCDCAAAASRRAWVRCVKQVTNGAIKSGEVPRACAKAAHRCEAAATCGRGDAVVCCEEKRGDVRGRIVKNAGRCRTGTVCTANPTTADACRPDAACGPPPLDDPGTAAWEPVPTARVAAECGLDPVILAEANGALDRPFAVIRHGKLCHEYYPPPRTVDEVNEAFSTTKTLGALVTGIAAWETRNLPRTGRKTGPISDLDRVDHWLDEFTFNPDAHLAHVLAMIGHNANLAYGQRTYQYDIVGGVQINRLSDVVTTALQQDPERLGTNLEEFTQRYLYAPLGMHASTWTNGDANKVYGFTWETTVRDMARVGLLMLNGGLWNGERILSSEWIYRMTHPSFEDTNYAYGYLTWLAIDSEDGLSQCAPPAIYGTYPHGLSEAPDCGFVSGRPCTQRYDAGVWAALGLFGQFIIGHRGLDLVLVAKDMGTQEDTTRLWRAVRRALVPLDPRFQGDEAAFCTAYDAGEYAPDLR
ncbi:MAG: serine hydrolase [bacterium]|nr:serine hydrolase [bacterium]